MKLAIIGGSLFGQVSGFTEVIEDSVKTPFGQPSDSYFIGKIDSTELVYLNRHARSHHLAPHQINYRANMFGLKMMGVTHVIAVTAVGGISPQTPPMQWVVPDQIIDYTYGRMQTYNDGNENAVNHIDFSYPFDERLRALLQMSVSAEGLDCITRATYGATQGPRLETIAEILRMERDGCDIVGMTVMPEAALARELEMEYAVLSLVVNWAAGKGSTEKGDEKPQAAEIISMDEIKQRIDDGNKLVSKIMTNFVTLS